MWRCCVGILLRSLLLRLEAELASAQEYVEAGAEASEARDVEESAQNDKKA